MIKLLLKENSSCVHKFKPCLYLHDTKSQIIICIILKVISSLGQMKMGNISSVPKERSLEYTLDMLRLKVQGPLSGSQTVWQSETLYKERHTLIMNMPRGLPWT